MSGGHAKGPHRAKRGHTGPSGAAQGQELTRDQWAAVRFRYVNGETAPRLAREFGCSLCSLKGRAKRERWREVGVSGIPGPVAPHLQMQINCNKPKNQSENTLELVPILSEILDSKTPQEFQSNLSRLAKSLVAQGIPDLAPPRNLSELKILNDIIRKADRLDEKVSSNTAIRLVSPMRAVRRSVREEPIEIESQEKTM
jgi:hypothetical protein